MLIVDLLSIMLIATTRFSHHISFVVCYEICKSKYLTAKQIVNCEKHKNCDVVFHSVNSFIDVSVCCVGYEYSFKIQSVSNNKREF